MQHFTIYSHLSIAILRHIYYNVKKEGDSKIITLYEYPDAWYGSTRSYQEPSMDFWIKEYFNIPQDVKFHWVDIYGGLR
jgi:hypothetical protein